MSAAEYEQIATLVQNLSDVDKIRLVEEVMSTIRQKIEAQQSKEPIKPRRSLRGLWKGVGVSAEDIDEARREMWGNFPREDIG